MSRAPEPIPPADPGWSRGFLAGGALLGLLTVALGAVAAHLPDRLLAAGGRPLLRDAVEMQGWHVPALLACGLLAQRRRDPLLRLAGCGFALGIACFCAGVDGLAFAGGAAWADAVGHAAPFGGTVLMLSWALLAAAVLRRRPDGG